MNEVLVQCVRFVRVRVRTTPCCQTGDACGGVCCGCYLFLARDVEPARLTRLPDVCKLSAVDSRLILLLPFALFYQPPPSRKKTLAREHTRTHFQYFAKNRSSLLLSGVENIRKGTRLATVHVTGLEAALADRRFVDISDATRARTREATSRD